MKSTQHIPQRTQPASSRLGTITKLAVALLFLSNGMHATAAENMGGTLDTSSCSKPAWPAEALSAKKTGTVSLALLIGSDGKVKQSRVLKSSGHTELDEAARTGIAKCSFTPGVVDGKPQTAWLQMQYVWTLD